MRNSRTALIMAAGTGGHVFPALSVARALSEKGYDIHWLGTPTGMENALVAKDGFRMHQVSIRGLRGKGVAGLLLAPFRVLQAVWQSLSVIRQVRPGVVVGFGGYIAGPGGVAARLSGVPLLIHEQNALAGMTNRLLNRIALVSLQAFPGALDGAIVVGNPVRKELLDASSEFSVNALPAEASPTEALPNDERAVDESSTDTDMNVLVVGGSLGAVAVNKVVLEVWKALPDTERPQLRHQVGARDYDNMLEQYQRSGLLENGNVVVQAFIDDMAKAYQWADLIVCRAGALTVSELAVAGKAAVLVPYPHAVDDHQTVNASYLVRAGAALVCQQDDFTVEWLRETLEQFKSSPEKLSEMASNSRGCAVLDATEQTLEQIERHYCER